MDPYQPPITPGRPQPPPPAQYYPQSAPPAPVPVQRDPNAGIRTAGTIAIWMWILAGLVPIALIVVCVGLCMFGAIFGHDSGTPRPVR